jgi:hypothetical protein
VAGAAPAIQGIIGICICMRGSTHSA